MAPPAATAPTEAALRDDLERLGDHHPQLALDESALAAHLAASGSLAEAERLATNAVAIVRERRATALHGEDGPESALARVRAQLNHGDPLGAVFETYLDIAWRLHSTGQDTDGIVSSRAFMAAQDRNGSATAHAMALAAARSAAAAGPLAAVLRQQQALTDQLIRLDRRLLALPPGQAGTAHRLQQELDRDMVELAAVNRQIDRDFPAYRTIISPLAIDLGEAQRALAPDEGLLLLAASHGNIDAFAVGPSGSAWHRIAAGETGTAALVEQLHCQVDALTCRSPAPPPGSVFEEHGYKRYDLTGAHHLYRTLIAPVEQPVHAARTIYVVTSGFLGDLPLAMLVSEPPREGIDQADPAVLREAAWLGDRHAFVQLPAVAGLRLRMVRARAYQTGSLDAYGDPVLGGSDPQAAWAPVVARSAGGGERPYADPATLRALPSLPGTRRELESMARAMGAPSTALHLQTEATERQVKHDPTLASAGVVVFATHGVLPGEIADQGEPGLILTPPAVASEEDDGILTSSEAAQLTLSADWVVLSACNTASLAGRGGPDSLSSLARGFLYAGAHALIASHWRVSDDATAALTVEALTIHRTHPDLTGAQALQAAMRAIRIGRHLDGSPIAEWHDDWSHPAAWAAFSYISDHDDTAGAAQ